MSMRRDSSSGPVRLIQLTDPHFFGDPNHDLYGVTCGGGFDAVIGHVTRHHADADALIVTGDLVHDYDDGAYQRLYRRLGMLGLPTYVIPGNHDDPARMRRNLIPPVEAPRRIRRGEWELVFLDSQQDGSEGGLLGEAELAALAAAMDGSEAKHLLVLLHHNPLPTGSRWLDSMTLADADAFFAAVDREPRVRGIVWGHVHQASEDERRGVRLMGTPSTCVQFAPGSNEFAVQTEAVGYRWLTLHDDGRIESAVEWLPRGE